MIEVGDLVRLKNSALRVRNNKFLGLKTRRRYRPPFKEFRGKQIIARVVSVNSEYYDWRAKRHNRVVTLDIIDEAWARLIGRRTQMTISTSYLTLHRKHNAGRDNRAVRRLS